MDKEGLGKDEDMVAIKTERERGNWAAYPHDTYTYLLAPVGVF